VRASAAEHPLEVEPPRGGGIAYMWERGRSRGARGGARWGFGRGVTGRGHGRGEDAANVVAACRRGMEAPPTPKRMAGAIGWAAQWAAPTVGPHKPLGCINRGAAMRFFISAIPATESVETWLISVSVCCLLLRLKALVCCSDFFGGARAAVRRWQNGSVAEQSEADYYCLLNK
jgi:hypothetical protein